MYDMRNFVRAAVLAAVVLPLVTAVSANASNDNDFDSEAQCKKQLALGAPPGAEYPDDMFHKLKFCRLGLDRKWHIYS